ncbi:MAG: phosphomannomutase/phosphoglucomutase [Rhodospirillaceae bacterium]|nr:phosphomannomutase/phosphoglucomutase [Rhodospirillaceae bacterium]MCY4065785.1 phosphomannomutase/phosphoglucomutase [Rhodospirillaceae bacterium]
MTASPTAGSPRRLPGHSLHPEILREYDVRGIVGETLFPSDARALGAAFGALVGQEGGLTVCVGWDGRHSSPALRDALIDGLTASGRRVFTVGRGPTPMLNFALHDRGADAGVMVTGSHNPGAHNGFKMTFGPGCGGGRPVFGDEIRELGRIAAAGIEAAAAPGDVAAIDVADAYADRLAAEAAGADLSRLTVVWDCGNGAAGEIAARLIARLAGAHRLLFAEIDGDFPNHHPDPTVAANLADLQAAVMREGANVGIAFDGDGDRIGVVDDSGAILWADQAMVYFAADLLGARPGARIIADVKASRVLFDEVARLGGRPEMYRTGHSLIKNRMRETGAPMAGEMSGHLFFADRYYGFDDALYAAVRLLRILAGDPAPLSAFRSALPPVFNTPEIRIPVDEARKFAIVEAVRARLEAQGADFADIDGVRTETEDGWWLLRASNTQAALSLRGEALTEAGLARLVDGLRGILADEGVDLPPI